VEWSEVIEQVAPESHNQSLASVEWREREVLTPTASWASPSTSLKTWLPLPVVAAQHGGSTSRLGSQCGGSVPVGAQKGEIGIPERNVLLGDGW